MRGPSNFNNDTLRNRAALLATAQRTPMTTGCPDNQGIATEPPTPPKTQKRWALNRVPFKFTAAGDNALISTLSGKKLIYEIVIWNVSAQSLALYQGPSASGILLLPLTDFPALTGFVLGMNGSFDMPHWEIDAGQPFVLNLAAATEVDGHVVYAVAGNS